MLNPLFLFVLIILGMSACRERSASQSLSTNHSADGISHPTEMTQIKYLISLISDGQSAVLPLQTEVSDNLLYSWSSSIATSAKCFNIDPLLIASILAVRSKLTDGGSAGLFGMTGMAYLVSVVNLNPEIEKSINCSLNIDPQTGYTWKGFWNLEDKNVTASNKQLKKLLGVNAQAEIVWSTVLLELAKQKVVLDKSKPASDLSNWLDLYFYWTACDGKSECQINPDFKKNPNNKELLGFRRLTVELVTELSQKLNPKALVRQSVITENSEEDDIL